MRIYFIGSKGIPSASIAGAGGVERHVEQIATRLAARGYKVYVYIRSHADYSKQTYEGVHLIRLPSIQTKNLDTITHTFLATLHVLFQKADIIHYHGVGSSTLSLIPRLLKWKSKTLVTFHSRDWFDSKWSWFAKLFLKFGEWSAVYFPHATIVTSHTLQVFCRKTWKRSTIYVPNGATLIGPQSDELVRELGLKPGKYLLGVGRLVPNKAYDVAAEAYKHVDSDTPLVIVGEPYYASAYDHRLHDLADKDPRVRLIGYQSGRALKQLYAHCYAFIHPSRSEGLSVTIVEAMAAGKLVIMSDIQENLELIDHSGIAFQTDNRKSLAEAMSLALSDPSMVEERGLRAREVVRKEYSWDKVVDRLEKIYASQIVDRRA